MQWTNQNFKQIHAAHHLLDSYPFVCLPKQYNGTKGFAQTFSGFMNADWLVKILLRSWNTEPFIAIALLRNLYILCLWHSPTLMILKLPWTFVQPFETNISAALAWGVTVNFQQQNKPLLFSRSSLQNPLPGNIQPLNSLLQNAAIVNSSCTACAKQTSDKPQTSLLYLLTTLWPDEWNNSFVCFCWVGNRTYDWTWRLCDVSTLELALNCLYG